VLVIAEVAVACALVVTSGLLVRSVSRMMAAPTGIVAQDVVTANIQLEVAKYRQWTEVEQFYSTLIEQVRRQPGVEFAGATNALPLTLGWRMPYAIEGRPAARPDEVPAAQIVTAGSGYFEALRARLVAGRFFTDNDSIAGEPVVVVNETFARQAFPGESALDRRVLSRVTAVGPLGRNLLFPPNPQQPMAFRIVGIVGDVHQSAIGRSQDPVIYHSQRQFPFRSMAIVARGPNTATVISGMRHALRAIDPAVPLSDIRTMNERLVAATAAPRLLMAVLTTFAVVTGVLAAIGVYGLMAWTVNERRRELAIRLALGAQPRSLAGLVTGHGLALAVIGVAIGLAGAQLARGLLQTVLFRTTTTDAGAIASAVVVLILSAAIACLAPARRAARVAPIEGLKET
jgi:putative ABC transport system permease protein